MNDPAPLRPRLSVRHLSVGLRPRGRLPGLRGRRILAIDDLHLDLRRGEIIGFSGESACGKTTLARALAGLQTLSSGSIRCEGEELAGPARAAALRYAVQLIEETPLADSKPKQRVGAIVGAGLRERYPQLGEPQRDAHVATLLVRVGLSAELIRAALKELDAGQRARVALARALCMQPQVLLCDEIATFGGDDPGEAFTELVVELSQAMGLSLILFAREPATLRGHCSRLLTMVHGKVMEQAPADTLLDAARHPYTRALLEQAPAAVTDEPGLAGRPPARRAPPPALQPPPMGCVFHPRCPLAESACVRSAPHLRRVGQDHYAACHFLA